MFTYDRKGKMQFLIGSRINSWSLLATEERKSLADSDFQVPPRYLKLLLFSSRYSRPRFRPVRIKKLYRRRD